MYGAVWLTQTLCSLFETGGPTPRQPCSIDALCERNGTKLFPLLKCTHIATAIDDFTTLKVRIIIGMSTSVATNRGQLTNMTTGSGPDLPLVGTACTCQITPCKHSYSYGKFHYSRKTASYTQQQPIYGQHIT